MCLRRHVSDVYRRLLFVCVSSVSVLLTILITIACMFFFCCVSLYSHNLLTMCDSVSICLLVRYVLCCCLDFFFFFKQKTAYELRISDWSSDVCSSDLRKRRPGDRTGTAPTGCRPRSARLRSSRTHRSRRLDRSGS